MLDRSISATVLAGCAVMFAAAAATPGPHPAGTAQAQIGSFGLDLSGGDPSVKPGDDFARYANGHWLDTTQIPADRSSWGSFAMLRERSLQQVREILEALPADSPAGGNPQKLHDFYRSYLDTDAIEHAGLAPAKPVLDAIAAAHADVIMMNMQHSPRTESMLGVSAYADVMRWVAEQHGVELFDRLAIMRYWSDEGVFDLYAATKDYAMARRVHECIGRALASLIINAGHLDAGKIQTTR